MCDVPHPGPRVASWRMARKRQRTGEAIVDSPPKAKAKASNDSLDAEEEKFRIWQLFVDDYHDMIVELPLEFERTFSLVRELEDAQQTHSSQLRTSLLSFLSASTAPPPQSASMTKTTTTSTTRSSDDGPSQHTRDLLANIAKNARAAVRAGEDKVNLCRALYENVCLAFSARTQKAKT